MPSIRISTALLAGVACLGGLVNPLRVQAEEPVLVTGEGTLAMPIGDPQDDLFGPGGSIAGGVYRSLSPFFLIGLRIRGGLLIDGDPPRDPGQKDPDLGGFGSLSLALRLRIPVVEGSDDPSRAVGPFVEAMGGAGVTGDLVRGALEGGIGWGFEADSFTIAPTIRYMHFIQPEDDLDDRDARILLLGAEFVLFDPRPEVVEYVPPPPSDRDGDGIMDEQDACPDDPEDLDGFEDEDGCPEPDNDQDQILDGEDSCPLIAEDHDQFEDEDGCPDPDNDGDRIVDRDDQCPNEPEVINGVDDRDGCPDEGLIELVDDRIVLDATVLFATDRWHVKRRAKPVLDAIVNLWEQHPEWLKIRIEGHTDFRGTDRYNRILSQRRADSVMEEMIQRGMPQEMLESVGYADTRPVTLGDSERSLQRNRRVEFVVVEQADTMRQGGDDGAWDSELGPSGSPAAQPPADAGDLKSAEPAAAETPAASDGSAEEESP